MTPPPPTDTTVPPDITAPNLESINPPTSKSCEALLATQKYLVNNSNELTRFLSDVKTTLVNMPQFTKMVKDMSQVVAGLQSIFTPDVVKDIKDIPHIKERITALEEKDDTPSPSFITEIQRKLHYTTLGHVYQQKVESNAHRLIINGIKKSATHQQMPLVDVVITNIINKMELIDDTASFISPTQVYEIGKDRESSDTYSLLAVFKHPEAAATIFKYIKKVPNGISIVKSVPEEYADKYKTFRKTQSDLRRVRASDNQPLVRTSIRFEKGFMILYYAHFVDSKWQPFKVYDYFFPEFKEFTTPVLANRTTDPITHRNVIFKVAQSEDRRNSITMDLGNKEKVLSARFNKSGWSCVVTFKNPITQAEIEDILKHDEVKEIRA